MNKRRVFILLCLAHITISFNLAAVAAVIPSMSRELGFSDVQVARIIPHYLWAYGIGALIYAPLTRWFSVRWLIMGSILLFSLSSFYCGITKSLDVLLFASSINGFAASSIVPLGLMTIGKLFEKKQRGRAVGLFFSASFIASLTGVLTSAVIHWSFLFIISSILGTITIISILLSRVTQISQPEGRTIDYSKALRNADVLKIFAFIFLLSFLYHGIYIWYGVYLDREYHLGQAAISSLILVTSVSGVAGQILGGIFTDLKSRFFTIALGVSILGTAAVLLAGHHPIVLLAAVLAMVSIGWTIGHNGISTALTDFPDTYRSELASLNSSIRFLSGGLGFYLSGFLIEQSFALNFLTIGIVFLILVPAIPFFIAGHLKAERKAYVEFER